MKRQQGISLLTAVFLLLMLSLMAVQMVRLGTVRQSTDALSISGTRVHYAARSGLEWAKGWVDKESTRRTNWCPARMELPLPLDRIGLRHYRTEITITCTRHDEMHNKNQARVFRVQSVAQLGGPGDPLYVQRRLEGWMMR